MTSPLRVRVRNAFIQAGGKWPVNRSAAIPLGGAALQCKTLRQASLVCDVVRGNDPLMLRNAKLLVFLCQVAGMHEADKWIGSELIQAVKEERRTKLIQGKLTYELTIDHPPRLIVLHIEERP